MFGRVWDELDETFLPSVGAMLCWGIVTSPTGSRLTCSECCVCCLSATSMVKNSTLSRRDCSIDRRSRHRVTSAWMHKAAATDTGTVALTRSWAKAVSLLLTNARRSFCVFIWKCTKNNNIIDMQYNSFIVQESTVIWYAVVFIELLKETLAILQTKLSVGDISGLLYRSRQRQQTVGIELAVAKGRVSKDAEEHFGIQVPHGLVLLI